MRKKRKTSRTSKKRTIRKRFVAYDGVDEIPIIEEMVVQMVEGIRIFDRSKKRHLRGIWDKEHADVLVKRLNSKEGKHLLPQLRYEL